jgi:hypothetical protein
VLSRGENGEFVNRIDVGIVRIDVAIASNTIGMPRAGIGRIRPLSRVRSWVNWRNNIVLRMDCRRGSVAVRTCTARSGLRKSPLDGTIDLVEIKIGQSVVSKSPDPWLWCARAFGKTETSGSVVPSTVSPTVRTGRNLWPRALSRGTELDV